jgi:hypothetical protein
LFFFAILLFVGASSGISLPSNSCPTASKKSLPLLRSLARSLVACLPACLRVLDPTLAPPPLLAIIFFSLYPHFLCTT